MKKQQVSAKSVVSNAFVCCFEGKDCILHAVLITFFQKGSLIYFNINCITFGVGGHANTSLLNKHT